MAQRKYLNEETYQRSKKKIGKIAIIVLIVGVLIGGGLITSGLIKQRKINSQYSEESKESLKTQLETEKGNILVQLENEKQNLIKSKSALETKIKPVKDQIKSLEREPFTGFNDAYYARKDQIEELEKSIESDEKSIDVIDDAISESFDHCRFDEAKNNSYTSKYCSIKNQLTAKEAEISEVDYHFSDLKKRSQSHGIIPFYMFGAFIIIASGMISFSIFMFTKRREILAFTAQQVIPVAKEGIEEMTPTIGKAAGTIGKEIAKGITSGIKEGTQEDKE